MWERYLLSSDQLFFPGFWFQKTEIQQNGEAMGIG